MQISVGTLSLLSALATSLLLSAPTVAQTTWTSADVGRSTPVGRTVGTG